MLLIEFKDSVERLAHVCYVYNLRSAALACEEILKELHDPCHRDLIRPAHDVIESELIDDAGQIACMACHFVAADLRDNFLTGKRCACHRETLRKISKLL